MKNIQIINKSNNQLPSYATMQSAGMDICADLHGNTPILKNAFLSIEDEKGPVINIRPGGRALVPTGIYISLPEGYEARIQPRSGLAIKKGITVLNSPGCIDADYRGEIGIILVNHGEELFTVAHGDKVAQMIISQVETVVWEVVNKLDNTERGDGGFGHTSEKQDQKEAIEQDPIIFPNESPTGESCDEELEVPANKRKRK